MEFSVLVIYFIVRIFCSLFLFPFFLNRHLEDLAASQKTCDHTNWIKTLQGLAMGIQCFGGELPFFFLSGWILKKIGHVHSMSLVLLGFAFRFYFYSILENPWYVLPIELLNGITFGTYTFYYFRILLHVLIFCLFRYFLFYNGQLRLYDRSTWNRSHLTSKKAIQVTCTF
jgi:hypothetical protein